MHHFLATVPFDLYELHLFQLVANHRSFSKAGAVAGLTQSAISRQIQAMEEKIGVPVFKRTTRQVDLTPAGKFLLERSIRIGSDVELCLTTLREEFANAPKQLRVGVSTTVSMAYLPGFFVAHRRAHPEVRLVISHLRSDTIVQKVDAGELDAGIVCPPTRLSRALQMTHGIDDAFALIFPRQFSPPPPAQPYRAPLWRKWIREQPWLQISEDTQTGWKLRDWLKARGWTPATTTYADNFDLIINLVSMGLGVSLVPQRALALYGRKKGIQRVAIPKRFSRQLVILTRRTPKQPGHIQEFLDHVLF